MPYLGFWEFFKVFFTILSSRGPANKYLDKIYFELKTLRNNIFGSFVEAFVSIVWRYLCTLCGGICVHIVEAFVATGVRPRGAIRP